MRPRATNCENMLLLYHLSPWMWNSLRFNPNALVFSVITPVFLGCGQSAAEAMDTGLIPKWASWHGPDLWPRPHPCSEPTILQMSALIFQGHGAKRRVSENPLWLGANKSVRVSAGSSMRCRPEVWLTPNEWQEAFRGRKMGLAAELFLIIE